MDTDIFQDDHDGFGTDGDLAQWVMTRCNDWRDHFEANFAPKMEEYYRLYRNQWSAEDMERKTERSKLIAPALAQAVESNVAEIEEATFGRGKIFDIKDDVRGQDPKQVAYLREKLHEDFAVTRLRSSIAEVLVNAAVFGTGIGEIVIEEKKVYTPTTQPMLDGMVSEIGVNESYRPVVKLNPIQPKNFLVDPAASCVEEAIGCAVDEYVSRHIVEELQEQGVYRDDQYVGNAASDEEIEFDPEVDTVAKDRVRLTKYYGKVPRDLLLAEDVDADDIAEPGHYVEAIVVVANEGVILKAIPNPYMCQDRPIVAFQWDIVPGVFWGRGVCEKGYMSQKALDAELRARIDALALTTHPMMAVDATRIPRGHKLEVRPGRMLMTNGNPNEAIQPFNFGQLNAITFQQGAQLQAMVSQATGAAGAEMQAPDRATASGMSQSTGAIVKRQKRTLVNFQENFLIPYVEKAAYRYMQFDPDNYPVQDYTFQVFSSLGAMAREYEVAQLTQMLQVVPPNSPAHGAIIKGVIDHLNVTNREEIMAAIDAANQPNPQQQQAEQQQQQMQMAITQGQVQLLNSQAAESQARAQKYNVEAQLAPTEVTLKYSDQNNDGMVDDDFEKRVKMAELLLKEQELQLKQDKEMEMTKAKAEGELIRQITEGMSDGEAVQEMPSGQASGGVPQG